MRLYKYIQKDIEQEDLQYQDLVEYNTGSVGHPVYPSKKSIIRNYLDAMDFYTPTDTDYACRYRVLTKIINKYYNYELFTDNYEYFGNRMLWRLNKIMPTYRAKFNSLLAQNGYEDIWEDGLLWEHREGTRDTKRPEKDTDNHPVNFDRTDLADTTTTVGYNSDYPQVIVGSSTDYNATGDKTTTGRTGNDTVTHAMQENVGYGEDITRKFSPEEIAKAKLLFSQLIFNIDEEIVNAVADLFVLVDYPFEDDFDVAAQMSILDDAKAYTNLKFNESKAYTDQEIAKAKEIVYIDYADATYSVVSSAVSDGKLPIIIDTYGKYWYFEEVSSGDYTFVNGIDWMTLDYGGQWTTGTLAPPQEVEVLHTSNTSYTFVDLALLSNTKLLFVEDDAGISGDYHTIFAYQNLNINEIVFSNVYQDSGTHYIRSLKFTFNTMEWTYEYYELQEKLIGLDGYAGQNIKEINGETILGTGSIDTKELFECTYGTTTYAQVIQALNDGKIPYVKTSQNYICYASSVTASYVRFGSLFSASPYYASVTSADVWSSGSGNLQRVSNLVSAWRATPDDTHYPSEKLVYDSLQNVGSNLFVGVQGVTTYAEITQAINDRKVPVVLTSSGIVLVYSGVSASRYYFRGMSTSLEGQQSVYVNSSNTWAASSASMQRKYLVTSWQATPDDTHYPSEKLVYDTIQGAVGSGVTSYLLDLDTYAYSSGAYYITIDITSSTKYTVNPDPSQGLQWFYSIFTNNDVHIGSIGASGFYLHMPQSTGKKIILTVYS